MKLLKICILLIVASVVLNYFFLSGCTALHYIVYGSNPCKCCNAYHGASGEKAELERIAALLCISTKEKSETEIIAKIRSKLECAVKVPQKIDATSLEKMATLQGKRVIVVEPED